MYGVSGAWLRERRKIQGSPDGKRVRRCIIHGRGGELLRMNAFARLQDLWEFAEAADE